MRRPSTHLAGGVGGTAVRENPAAERVQQRVGARNYLIFDMLVRQHTPLRDICRSLGVNAAQVYLAKHRVGRMMKQEVDKLRNGRE